jgi:hypothetical protein
VKPALALLPLTIQAVAMGFDELHFHRKRGLERWERLGHPLDTLTMLASVAWILQMPPTPHHVAVYVALASFSCLFITKDEFVHTRACEATEHWVHALLFVIHPVTLLTLALLWPSLYPHSPDSIPLLWNMANAAFARAVLWGELAATAGFCLYQATYWNHPWTRRAPPAV